MGVLQDLFDFAKALDKNPPLEANRRIVSSEFVEIFNKYGDLDYPEGIGNRPAYALLNLLGVVGKPFPGFKQSGPVNGTLLRGDNLNAPKEVTIRWLAFEAAIETQNPQLEKNILEAIGYRVDNPNAFSNAPPPEGTLPWTPCALTVNDYVHRWSADEQTNLRDGDLVSRVVDGGSGGIDLVAPVGEESTFVEDGFNNQPGFAFRDFNKSRLESESNVTLFPSKKGTIIWVNQLKESFNFKQKVMIDVSSLSEEKFYFLRVDKSQRPWSFESVADPSTGVNLQIPPPDQYPQNIIQLFTVQRTSDTQLLSRINGGDQKETAINDYTSVPGLFRCGKAADASNLYIDHDLAIILIYDRVLTSIELITTEIELADCYGVIA